MNLEQGQDGRKEERTFGYIMIQILWTRMQTSWPTVTSQDIEKQLDE
jgi:hypothetical protein